MKNLFFLQFNAVLAFKSIGEQLLSEDVADRSLSPNTCGKGIVYNNKKKNEQMILTRFIFRQNNFQLLQDKRKVIAVKINKEKKYALLQCRMHKGQLKLFFIKWKLSCDKNTSIDKYLPQKFHKYMTNDHLDEDFELVSGEKKTVKCQEGECTLVCNQNNKYDQAWLVYKEWTPSCNKNTIILTAKNITEANLSDYLNKGHLDKDFDLVAGKEKTVKCQDGGCTLVCLERDDNVFLVYREWIPEAEQCVPANLVFANLDFKDVRLNQAMYTMRTEHAFYRTRKVTCRHAPERTTYLQCHKGKVLDNFDCPMMEQNLCLQHKQIQNSELLDLSFGCMDPHGEQEYHKSERYFKCRYPDAEGSYAYMTLVTLRVKEKTFTIEKQFPCPGKMVRN